jgi:uncharacterized protein
MICYEIANGLLDWLAPFKPKEVLTIAGIITNEPEKRVFGVATTADALKRIQEHTQILPIGSISGIASSILRNAGSAASPAMAFLERPSMLLIQGHRLQQLKC